MNFLNGCEAVARGAWEGGATFSCPYPGSPVTGIIDALKQYPDIKSLWVANEKVGMEVAIGIAHAGMRSLVIMKHVGLNVAADPDHPVGPDWYHAGDRRSDRFHRVAGQQLYDRSGHRRRWRLECLNGLRYSV